MSIIQDTVNYLRGWKREFIDNYDVPNSYTGESGKALIVNSSENGIEFDSVFESGVVMLFAMSSAPTGWTRNTGVGVDDRMLRIVDGVGGGSGGTDSPILMDKVPVHTHTGNTDNDSHYHLQGGRYSPMSLVYGYTATTAAQAAKGSDGAYTWLPHTSTDTHSHTITMNNNTGSNWTPKYKDIIECTKD